MSQVSRVDAIAYPFPQKPIPLTAADSEWYENEITRLLIEKNAALVAHYYTDPEIQALAEKTGGFISDLSLIHI